jgi:hypothetical protein
VVVPTEAKEEEKKKKHTSYAWNLRIGASK